MNFDPKKYLLDLGYSPLAPPPTTIELKKAWRTLCQKHHPDHGGDPEAFRKVMHAYKMLTDAEYRHAELVREIRSTNPNAGGDLNIRLHVPISFEDAFFGRTVVVSYNRLNLDADWKPIMGDGKLDVVTEAVVVPAGAMQGFEGMIQNGGHRREELFGHAVAVFTVMGHPKFTVQGQDVVAKESFPLEVLLKGAKVEVQTMYGLKTLRIPPGTKPGDQLTLSRCGVRTSGKHVVEVDVVYPSKADLRKDAWKGLGIDWAEHAAEEEDPLDREFNSIFIKIGGVNVGTAGGWGR